MNARLHTLLTAAEAQLAPADQDVLADILAQFLANRQGAAFTPEELAHIRLIEDEPFIPADPEEFAAFFARGK